MDIKRKLEISKLNRILGMLYASKDEYALQYSWFDWCVYGLMLVDKFEKEFKLAGKELLKHFNIPQLNTIEEINEYFLKIYNVHHPIRNNIKRLWIVFKVIDYIKLINDKLNLKKQ